MDVDDGQVWSRSRAGDAEAFAVLFDRYAKPIYNYSFRRLGNWAAAEDMVSLVFLEAWRRRRRGAAIQRRCCLAVRDRHQRASEPAPRGARFSAALPQPQPRPERAFRTD